MPDDLYQKRKMETERLVLRPYQVADAAQAHAIFDLHPEIWKHDPGYQRSLLQRRKVIARYEILHNQFGFGPCAAFSREDGRLIGQGGLNPYMFRHKDGTQTAEFEVMYKIARPYWRQGFAIELARFWASFAFETVGLRRLITCPAKANPGSVAVLRALGCRIEDDWLEPDRVITILERPHVDQ